MLSLSKHHPELLPRDISPLRLRNQSPYSVYQSGESTAIQTHRRRIWGRTATIVSSKSQNGQRQTADAYYFNVPVGPATADATTLRGANLVVPTTIALNGIRGKTLAYPSGRMLTPTSYPSPNPSPDSQKPSHYPPPDSQKPTTVHRLTQGNAATNTNQSPTVIVLY